MLQGRGGGISIKQKKEARIWVKQKKKKRKKIGVIDRSAKGERVKR